MTHAVEKGLPKQHIERAAAARQARVDKGEDVIVGVNKYRLADEDEIDILDIDNAKVRADQIRRIERVKAERDEGRRSEEHTSELQSLMRISYAVFCLKKKKKR